MPAVQAWETEDVDFGLLLLDLSAVCPLLEVLVVSPSTGALPLETSSELASKVLSGFLRSPPLLSFVILCL